MMNTILAMAMATALVNGQGNSGNSNGNGNNGNGNGNAFGNDNENTQQGSVNGRPFQESSSEISNLQSQIDGLQTAFEGFEDDLEELQESVDCLKPVLDYWYGNGQTQLTYPADSRDNLVTLQELCLPAGTMIDVIAQATTFNKVNKFCMSIHLDDVEVARGCANDELAVESVSTFYRGNLTEDTTVKLKVGAVKAGKIAKEGLQFGARAYDSDCFDVVDVLPMDYTCSE